MFCSIESVTLGVRNLESGLQFFRDRMGMRVVNDSRASVGLLSAWRQPVHESVRLVDLASTTTLAPSATATTRLADGRIRLACYEDGLHKNAQTDEASAPPARGAWALELVAGAHSSNSNVPSSATTDSRSTSPQATNVESQLVFGPDALALITTGEGKPANLSAIWIASTDIAAAKRFYADTLGLSPAERSDTPAPFSSSPIAQQVSFHSSDPTSLRIVTAHFTSTDQRTASMSAGQLGLNLITIRCDDLDELEKRLDAIGISPLTRPTHVGMPHGYPSRVMIVPGPNGELFEFDEITE